MNPENRHSLGTRCRERVERHFSMALFAERSKVVWSKYARFSWGGDIFGRVQEHLPMSVQGIFPETWRDEGPSLTSPEPARGTARS